jgi:uncharacterized RDD family membrane protein YckC
MTTPEDPNQPGDPSPFAAPSPGSGSPPPPPPQYGGAPQYNAPPPYNAPPAYGAPSDTGAPPPYGGTDYGQSPYGRPSGSAYGGNTLAHWGYRVGAAVLDAVIIGVPLIIISVAIDSRAVSDVLSLVANLGFGYLNGAQGQTPGKRIVGIKVLRESDGQLIGGGMGILRAIAHILDAISCLIGYLWPLWDAKRQTFADKVIGTVVIKV